MFIIVLKIDSLNYEEFKFWLLLSFVRQIEGKCVQQ